MLRVGIDLGGTSIAAGVVDAQGSILYKDSCPTGAGREYQAILKDMADLVLRVVAQSGHTMADIESVGIGSPGVADGKAGVLVFANNLFWRNVPVRAELSRYIDKPIHIDNDANVAALAEQVAGACRGAQNAIVLTLGTGVGSGIIINGGIYGGSHNVGAELGHLCVEVDGIPCTCGNRGCWERYTSATALISWGREAMAANPNGAIAQAAAGDADKVTAKTVMDCAKAGDPDAVAIFDKYIHYLGMGIITIINSFDPEVIAIGGGVAAAGAFLLDAIQEEVREHIFYRDLEYARIVPAQLGNDAGIIGAAMLS